MKKQLLTAVALVATLSELNAGILDNTLNTAGNLTNDALNVPGDIVRGPNRTHRRQGSFFDRNRDVNDEFNTGFYNPED